jgi:hypothetical protein
MQERFVAMIEELTGRKVAAFMSATARTPISRWRYSC